ncbi:rho guanine nucleotide exchange factor 2 isoform X1 [Solea solea]|uniref:rho guanine nucleotide exchange factor 2 isoform X1 n=1 Tax=Solea solea TaxID=90069 RepID=UPI00272C77B4|nr:rho guanine nucleotide exchange factor 2 isoform X1 [Solea solea]XP_058503170.1 rho guanine nucleotide exchange factor 2 isoform X1 [Solea solea]
MSRLLESRRQDRMKEINLKNKEKERLKEREKEAREREARSSNGHLFTSLTVSSTTLCSSCNRSITAKEALSCPACNVTIHNRCRDSLASCAKMKQRQQKLSLVRNSSALQNVHLRTKTPTIKERPSSAIYPSDLRQSFLGSRRVRSGLSLAKSVSTNNISGGIDDSAGLRRILSHSTESLNFRSRTLSMESLTDEGEWWWSPLLEQLQDEGSCVQVDSWSLAVEPNFLQTLHKDVIRRQDVIYELIQTEFHHVRTLRIMEGVYRRGMQEEVLLEAGVVHSIFPCLDQMLEFHANFLSQLLVLRKEGLVDGSSTNFTVHRIGDLLLRQFSGQCADDMKKLYSQFCSRHPKAVKLYKEVMARDRRLQQFVRRVCRGPLLRRHGVQECILLVTQRITKYPVLIQRILDYTRDTEGEEFQTLSRALQRLKELISSVDQEVLELDQTRRLQEIQARLDPRAQAEVRGGEVFRGGELLRRRLLHEGALLWKVQGSRMKDVQVLLMSDILVFLQEKDQKFTFASLDKSPVVSLTNLIVRDIANQERGMYLISASTPPEMYELYASSKEDRRTWMTRIQQAALSCPSREEFPLIETEDKALLRRLRADIQQKDREVLELLQERVTLFSDLMEATGREETQGREEVSASCRNLFRANTPHAPQAEPLLTAAITEVDKLMELLFVPRSSVTNSNQQLNGDSQKSNGLFKEPKDTNGNQLQQQTLNKKVCQRLVHLSLKLHALQAAVIRQDSILELSTTSTTQGSTPSPQSGPRFSRSVSRDTGLDSSGEVVLLRQQVDVLQEELTRLRLRGARKEAEPGGKRRGNVEVNDVIREEQQVSKRRGSKELEPRPLIPLVSQDPVSQLDGVQEENKEVEDELMKISPRSDSPRDLQDIPEESECGADPS